MAGRATASRTACTPSSQARFPFDETPDQQRAIDDVLGDFGREKPMDRLVCGDVGYGKTEVAMRAAWVAASAGKQVAFLVPTTVLAQQHLETLRGRFQDYPVSIEMLSRFRSTAENKATLARLAAAGSTWWSARTASSRRTSPSGTSGFSS